MMDDNNNMSNTIDDDDDAQIKYIYSLYKSRLPNSSSI